MSNVDHIIKICQRLKYAWVPFFSRFGKLTPIQIETIPKILSRINVVVASPTASGKTEAVVAPIAERFVSERWNGLAILYVVPTRALANDTLVRIEGPLRDMGITTVLKHGDKPYLSDDLPNCLITTPESLDSLICRRPKIFALLRAVILDEIHLLDNTYRGDQLRLLLHRLKKVVADASFAVHLLSATLSEPYQVAQRYSENFELITVKGQREINYRLLESHKDIFHLVRTQKWKKLLYFCNKRESVETVAAELAKLWHPYPVVAHHGSLNRQVREEAEKIMKETGVAVCVATSTLEIGIDIGDIDLVVLAEPPWCISALLQRIGRGNRRAGIIQVVGIVSCDEEKSFMETMFNTAKTGALPPESYEPDLSVAVQQIFSLLYQYRNGMRETELIELLLSLCSPNEVKLILGHLRDKSWIEYRMGYWCASTRLMDMGKKGSIHSNIPDSKTYKVIDTDSGSEIGTIAGLFDETFVLARRTWKVVSVIGDIINVQRFKGEANAALFKRHKKVGAFYYLLPAELKCKIS
ncbi:MAG: DEAD/DEAH box helicase [Candidatus Brocadia sp.]|jgi:ATP-dependent Lhr-like helicase